MFYFIIALGIEMVWKWNVLFWLALCWIYLHLCHRYLGTNLQDWLEKFMLVSLNPLKTKVVGKTGMTRQMKAIKVRRRHRVLEKQERHTFFSSNPSIFILPVHYISWLTHHQSLSISSDQQLREKAHYRLRKIEYTM